LSVADRREKATNRNLVSSYETYRKAYLVDLNHFYSGLAALQMGVIAQELALDPTWQDAFEDSEQATAYKSELGRQVEALRSSVRLAINAAIERLTREDMDPVWANIGRADLLFLTEERDQRVVQAYRDAVPKTMPLPGMRQRASCSCLPALGFGPRGRRASLGNWTLTSNPPSQFRVCISSSLLATALTSPAAQFHASRPTGNS
jgi:hypothetical protein